MATVPFKKLGELRPLPAVSRSHRNQASRRAKEYATQKCETFHLGLSWMTAMYNVETNQTEGPPSMFSCYGTRWSQRNPQRGPLIHLHRSIYMLFAVAWNNGGDESYFPAQNCVQCATAYKCGRLNSVQPIRGG